LVCRPVTEADQATYRLTLGGGQLVHPILVELMESRDQRKGWLAWRLAVDL
jgi:hypothetical protein